MPDQLPEAWREKLARGLHLPNNEEREIDELAAVLLQIALAIMLVFMIAFFIFMDKTGGEINQLDDLKHRLAQAEQAKVLQQLEVVANFYRQRYALMQFIHCDPTSGTVSYQLPSELASGNIPRHQTWGRNFIRSAQTAQRDYSQPDKLQKAWRRALDQKLPAGNAAMQQFLQRALPAKIAQVHREIVELQTLAALEMQRFLVRHPERMRDPGIRQLLTRINRTPDSPDREARLYELHRKLRRYVYDRLAVQCEAAMLEEK